MDNQELQIKLKILKEMTPDMTAQLRWGYKKKIEEPNKNPNSKLIYDLLNEIKTLREEKAEQRVTISRLKNEVYQFKTYGIMDTSFQRKK
tara:strand:- start:478 stop:747 length:270 start_codon:yes stop_codon:yes gene_type:complete